MNGGSLEDKHHVPRSEPKLFVKEAGRDGRIYYRRRDSVRTVLIHLVGDQHTKAADYQVMQQ